MLKSTYDEFDLLSYIAQENLLANDQLQSINTNLHLAPQLLNYLSSTQILNVCKKYFTFPYFNLSDIEERLILTPLIPICLIQRYHVMPLQIKDHELTLGVSDPSINLSAISFYTSYQLKLVLVDENKLAPLINKIISLHTIEAELENTLATIEPSIAEAVQDIDEQEPITKYVDILLANAIANHISDIHIEPYQTSYRVRFRRDGLLYEASILPPHLAQRVCTKLKIMANLDIAEKRLPQDGRIVISQPKMNIRISTCPLVHGEKLVLRIMQTNIAAYQLQNMGFLATQLTLFLEKLQKHQGLIIVTGATGSGKTMTLYSAINYLNDMENNIISIEDPVEMQIPGINQININPKIGLNFASILRTLLRQDPNIIMLGEMRDTETAKLAIQTAQTGHLVLSTLHTNSADQALNRLITMGIAPYQLMGSLSLIISQRLMRKLCELCKIPTTIEWENQKMSVYAAAGCADCYKGYRGRVAAFELLAINPSVALTDSGLQNDLHYSCAMQLQKAGLEKVFLGETSHTEFLKVFAY